MASSSTASRSRRSPCGGWRPGRSSCSGRSVSGSNGVVSRAVPTDRTRPPAGAGASTTSPMGSGGGAPARDPRAGPRAAHAREPEEGAPPPQRARRDRNHRGIEPNEEGSGGPRSFQGLQLEDLGHLASDPQGFDVLAPADDGTRQVGRANVITGLIQHQYTS